ncbi:MAG: glycosyltransferase family 2 protein [Firmicutes bacterium]|nr:glycosyltransferase family 2 protein [Bacillota bacterium]
MKSNVLIIIPAYNEEQSILQTVTLLKQTTQYDYIVINDGSTDTTYSILQEHNIESITLPINLGIGGAMQTGYKYAKRHNYDFAIQLDADGQHNPKDLQLLVSTIQSTGADMVIGSRFFEKTNYRGAVTRRAGIFYFYALLKLIAGISITDPTSGYRVVNKRVIEQFSKDYPVDYPEVEVLAKLAKKGYQIQEVKVEMNNRQGGTSSITNVKAFYYMVKVTFFSIIRSIF